LTIHNLLTSSLITFNALSISSELALTSANLTDVAGYAALVTIEQSNKPSILIISLFNSPLIPLYQISPSEGIVKANEHSL